MKKVLITENNFQNAYIPSLIEAYKRAKCEVVAGGAISFYLSNFKPDILHIHWPETLYKKDVSLFGNPEEIISKQIRWYKKNGTKIVFTVHNIKPHDSTDKERDYFVYNSIIKESDVIVHHGKASIALLSKEYPEVLTKKNIVCKHGDYLIQYKDISKEEARSHLRLPQEKFIMLYFGKFRTYKGFALIKNIYSKWPRSNKFLLIAGAKVKVKEKKLYRRLFFRPVFFSTSSIWLKR